MIFIISNPIFDTSYVFLARLSQSADITSMPDSVPLASVMQCNLSMNISFISLPEKWSMFLGFTVHIKILSTTALTIWSNYNLQLLCEHKRGSAGIYSKSS